MSWRSRISVWLWGWSWISSLELRAAMSGKTPPKIVDVRDAQEFSGPLGHLPGAENFPVAQLAQNPDALASLRRDAPVVLLCLTDKRSSAMAALLRRTGRSNIRVLKGGMKSWTAAGLPVVR